VPNTLRELILYTCVSAVALVVDAGALFVLVYCGVNYIVAATIGFLLGLACNYLASIRWVFRERRFTRRFEAGMFAVIGVVGLFANDAIIYVAVHDAGAPLVIAKAVSVVLVFGWNFGARKYMLFRSA
jgi:putative flippase GtrA